MNRPGLLCVACLAALLSSACSSEEPGTAEAQVSPAPLAQASADPGDPACVTGADCAAHAAAAAAAPGPVERDDGSQLFGAELDEAVASRELSALLAEPAAYDGQVVQTEGVISQVCQRMGCWMELRESESGQAIRVPMAGHSFFLPRDVAGRRATVQGTVEVRELSPAAQEHLRSEGAQVADQTLGIAATAVLVHAPS